MGASETRICVHVWNMKQEYTGKCVRANSFNVTATASCLTISALCCDRSARILQCILCMFSRIFVAGAQFSSTQLYSRIHTYNVCIPRCGACILCVGIPWKVHLSFFSGVCVAVRCRPALCMHGKHRMRAFYPIRTLENYFALNWTLIWYIIFSRMNATHRYATERIFGRGPSRSE